MFEVVFWLLFRTLFSPLNESSCFKCLIIVRGHHSIYPKNLGKESHLFNQHLLRFYGLRPPVNTRIVEVKNLSLFLKEQSEEEKLVKLPYSMINIKIGGRKEWSVFFENRKFYDTLEHRSCGLSAFTVREYVMTINSPPSHSTITNPIIDIWPYFKTRKGISQWLTHSP